MKVESHNDVQTIQRLGQPVISTTPGPAAPAKGADELSHLFNQAVEVNQLALTQRKVGLRVPPTTQMARLYDLLGHPGKAALAVVSRQIRMQLLKDPSVDKLNELMGKDPALTFVALSFVAAQADTEVRPSEAALARAALAKLEVRFKGEIQAGLNIAVALEKDWGDPQECHALRSLYYASVVARQSLATIMQALLGLYGAERFHRGLKLMCKALAGDIAASVSSTPTAQLRSLLRGLRSCGHLDAVLNGCLELHRRQGIIGQDAVALLQRLLGYAGSGIDTDEILRLGNELGGGTATGRLVALNSLYLLIRQLPEALWSDSQVREKTVLTLIAVLDELRRIEKIKPSADVPRATT